LSIFFIKKQKIFTEQWLISIVEVENEHIADTTYN